MECEVRAVGGIESCYVSLPLSLIHCFDASRPNRHNILFLQLRSSSNPSLLWHVAWSGAAASSAAIEVSQQFAECIALPDCSLVVVRALPKVPRATFVTIEPLTADDWEVLELNSDAAEAAILSQVRILNESMRFPLWLHGHAVVTFVVVSTVPKNTVVQLVPGTEVAVAPKRRQNSGSYSKESNMQSLDGSPPFEPVLLRVQDSKKALVHKSKIGGVDIGIELSTIALIHPDTGKSYSFDPLQVVVLVPRVRLKTKLNGNANDGTLRNKLSSSLRETNGRTSTHDTESHYAVVRILFSEKVAKGHMMLSLPLRCYLRASPHSWVYVQKYVNHLKKDLPIFSISPCQFIMLKKNREPKSNDLEAIENDSLPRSMVAHDSEGNIGAADWSVYQDRVSALPFEPASKGGEDAASLSDARKGINDLLYSWFMAQIHAIKSMAGVESSSVVLGPRTFLHFKLGSTGCDEKMQISKTYFSDRSGAMEPVKEILCSLSTSSEQLNHEDFEAYDLSIGPNKASFLAFATENLVVGDAVSFESVKEEAFTPQLSSISSDLNWISGPASEVTNRLKKLLSPASGLEFAFNFLLPGHILIYGPSGCGKSLLVSAIAKSLEEDDHLVHIVYVPCSAFVSEKVMTIRQELQQSVSEALDHAPALIILDDLDRIIPSSVDSEGPDESASIALSEFVTGIIDEYEEKGMESCGLGPVAFIACVQNLDSIPQSLRTTGRFDFHIQLPAPASLERMAILKHELLKHFSECSENILHQVASKAEGYDAHDLETLTNRSILVSMSHAVDPDTDFERKGMQSLFVDDFLQAMEEFVPSAMHDVTDSSLKAGRPGWEDVGGLVDVQNAIKEMIELPSKFPNVFAKSPLRLRSNVLLYGPPGCGKTHIVGAAAAASSLRFISIKGPELLNKYIGASEQSVRDVFAKAAAARPCLLFFDEFDSIAPKRGHDNTGVTDRVVNQFLTELDGVEVLTGVFVFAATSRPDLLDAALLRPGRLDRLIFCDFPSVGDRVDIIRALSRKLPLADDVDLTAIAHMTEGFSGADLRALLSDAEEAAIKELKRCADEGKPKKSLVLTSELLKTVASKAKPSVSESEKKRLYGIYSQFLDTKKSVASQSRDRKGKRATLA